MLGLGRIKENQAIGLTHEGRRIAEAAEGDGSHFLVLATIFDNGGVSTPDEIAKECNLKVDDVKRILERFRKAGYVRAEKRE